MAFLITFTEYSFQNLTTGGSTCAILYVTYVRGYPTHFAIHTIPYHTSKMPYFCKLTQNAFLKARAELTCLIRPKMGIVSCPTLSITKLLNQQEAGCIHLGSKRSFLMRRRSVFHHIYPPNSKKVWCCIW